MATVVREELHSEVLEFLDQKEVERPNPLPRSVLLLSIATGVLATVSSIVGLLWRGSGPVISVTNIFGERVELYGRGLYENDTLFFAGNNFASDLVALVVVVPLLAVTLRLSMRGSERGRLLLLGLFGYLVYHSSTYALGGVAFNELFIPYVAFFSTSVFGLVLLLGDLMRTPVRFGDSAPRRMLGIFMIVSGAVTALIWLMEPVGSLLSGEPPKSLETHTTLFTHALDLGIIVPSAIAIGGLILKRRTFGYNAAFSLLIFEALLLPLITIGTITQLELGIEFSPPEIVGPIAGFSILSGFSLVVIVRLLNSVTPNHARGTAR